MKSSIRAMTLPMIAMTLTLMVVVDMSMSVSIRKAIKSKNQFSIIPMVDASQAAGTETLVGIVGRDFVLLGADTGVSQSISLTSSNVDKISVIVDPQIDMITITDTKNKSMRSIDSVHIDDETILTRTPLSLKHQMPLVAAAAGDAADTDRLLSFLRRRASIEEYSTSGCWNSDVEVWDIVRISKSTDANGDDFSNAAAMNKRIPYSDQTGHDVHSLSQLTRRLIANQLRSRTPLRVSMLVAGMHLELASDAVTQPQTLKVQRQVEQALTHLADESTPTTSTTGGPTNTSHSTTQENSSSMSSPVQYKPYLYWLDEYGSCQQVSYGAQGYASNFLLSVLDRGYKPSMSKQEAIELMKDCFRQLRLRYIINSGPEAPCIKCIDENGVVEIPIEM